MTSYGKAFGATRLDGELITDTAGNVYAYSDGDFVVITGGSEQFRISSTGNITSPSTSDVANVKAFGAKGTGSGNDTAAIQAALDSLPSGGMLWFPAGFYPHNQISTNKRIVIAGEGPEKSISARHSSESSGILWNINAGGSTLADFEIKNMSFDMGSTDQTTTAVALYQVQGLIQNVKFRRGNIGLRLDHCGDLTIVNWRAINTLRGISIQNPSGDLGLTNAIIKNGRYELSDLNITGHAAVEIVQCYLAGLCIDNVWCITNGVGGMKQDYGFYFDNGSTIPTGVDGHFIFMSNCQTDGMQGGTGSNGLYAHNIRELHSVNNFWGCLPSAAAPGVVVDGGRDFHFSNDWISGSGIQFLGTQGPTVGAILSNCTLPQTSGTDAIQLPVTNPPTNISVSNCRPYNNFATGANLTRLQTAMKHGFYGKTPIVIPTVSGAKGSNAALGSLMTALANLGLVIDSTSA